MPSKLFISNPMFDGLDPAARDDDDPLWLAEYPSWGGMDDSFAKYQREMNVGAALLHLLVSTPRKAIRELLALRLATLSPIRRYIGMHVRHGDKAYEFALLPFSGYMDQVKTLSQTHGIRDVYLATDNSSILEHELTHYPELRFTTQSMVRSGQVGGIEGYWGAGYTSKLELFMVSLVDIVKLAGSDLFIGSQRSGFTHLVQEIG